MIHLQKKKKGNILKELFPECSPVFIIGGWQAEKEEGRELHVCGCEKKNRI